MIDLHKLFAKSYFTSESSLYTHSDLHHCVSSAGQSHTQPIFIQHSTLSLNNASKVNQSSCNSILCKPYLFARAGEARLDWARLSGARGDGERSQTISLPLFSLSLRCVERPLIFSMVCLAL